MASRMLLTRRAAATAARARAPLMPPSSPLRLLGTTRAAPSARHLHASPAPRHGDFEMQDPKSPDEVVRLFVVTRTGERVAVQGKIGDNLLYLAHRWRNDNPELALEGACEASLACSTCHVIIGEEHYDILDEPTEDEEDMLDEATCLSATSRLGCQIILSKQLDGMQITLPAYSRNFAVDGFVPEPH